MQWIRFLTGKSHFCVVFLFFCRISKTAATDLSTILGGDYAQIVDTPEDQGG